MADPLSIASGIAGLLNIAGLVFSRTYKFAKAAKGAESNIKALADEVRTLAGLLQSLSLVATELETSPADSAFRLHHVISCQQLLLRIERRTKEADPTQYGESTARAFLKKLKWPFSSTETMELVTEVSRHQRLITVALSADSITSLQQLLSGQEGLREEVYDLKQELERRWALETRISLDTKRQEILQFFGSIDPAVNHETSMGLRHRETGGWLLCHENFLAWMNNMRAKLWLSGIPGAGKTILASAVIEESLRHSTQERAVAYFYCDYKDERLQYLPNILGTIACQLARQDASQRNFQLLQDYYQLCHPLDRPVSPPKAQVLINIIQDMSASFQEVSIVVDALDECGKNRTEVVEALASLNESITSNVRTLFLSRDEPDIKNILDGFTHIPIAAHSDDLKIYVAEEIDTRTRKGKLRIKSLNLKHQIMERLINGAEGMFRWVACQLDYLCELPHDRARREALEKLPPDLNSTYERILARVASEAPVTQRIVRNTLFWTIHARDPLTVDALCEALSVDLSTRVLDPESQTDEEDILKYCSSLLRKSVHGDTLELAHFTVKEFLCSSVLNNHPSLSFYYAGEEGSSLYLAMTCLNYLNCDNFNHELVKDYETWQAFDSTHPFRTHASLNWSQYFSNHWDNRSLQDQARKLFHPEISPNFLNWAQAFAFGHSRRRYLLPEQVFLELTSTVTTNGVTPLHLAATLRIESLSEWLLEEGCDVNQLSKLGTTLHCVLLGPMAIIGQLRQLPSLPVSLPSSTDKGMLALFSQNGADCTCAYVDVSGQYFNAMRIILTFDPTDSSREKLFSLLPGIISSFDNGCFDIIEGWVEKKQYEKARDFLNAIGKQQLDDQLRKKIKNLSERVGKLSSEVKTKSSRQHDLSVETDLNPLELLSLAVKLDATSTLKKILGESPRNINRTLDKGMTILHSAACNGSLSAAKYLIKSGAFIDAKDSSGQTPLHTSVYSRNPEVFKLLLEEGADLEQIDNAGQTVWHLAASENNVAVLEFLLQHVQDIPRSLKTLNSRNLTPLFSAVEARSEDSLLLLLRHKISFEGSTEDGRMFAHFAVSLTLSTLKLLVNEGLDLKTRSNDGSSVLHQLAAVLPLEGLESRKTFSQKLDFLLSRNLDPTFCNENGQTPLHVLLSRSSWSRNISTDGNAVLEMPSSPTLRGKSGGPIPLPSAPPLPHPLLEYASFSKIVERLATNETVTRADCFGKTVLELFCRHKEIFEKEIEILKILFKSGAAAVPQDLEEQTYLQIFFEQHSKEGLFGGSQTRFINLLSLFLDEMGSCSAVKRTSIGARILYWAVNHSQTEVIKKLLAHGVDPATRIAEENHHSALERTCEVGSPMHIFRMLLEKCDAEAINGTHPKTGRNLIHTVCSSFSIGNVEILQALLDAGVDVDALDSQFRQTPLHFAVLSDKTVCIRLLLQAGADIYRKGNLRVAPTHWAAWSGSSSCLELIDGLGARKELSSGGTRFPFHHKSSELTKTFLGCNVWHIAAGCYLHTSISALSYLFDHGIFEDVDIPTTGKETALHISTLRGNTRAVRWLLSKRANPNYENEHGRTPLHIAAEVGDVAIIHILASAGAKVDAMNSNGLLPLHLAASNGHIGAIEALLKLGSPYLPSKDGYTPYFSARIACHEIAASVLQKYEISTTGSHDSYFAPGQNPSAYRPLVNALELAIYHRDKELCEKLVRSGVRPKIIHEGCDSCTPVCCSMFHSPPIARFFIEQGFPITGRICQLNAGAGSTPLILALPQEFNDILSLILDRRPSIQSISRDYAVHAAVYLNSYGSLQALLNYVREQTNESDLRNDLVNNKAWHSDLPWAAHAAKVRLPKLGIEDIKGFTPLHLAAATGATSAAKLLLENGANVHATDDGHRTPLHHAALIRSTEMVSLLLQHGAHPNARDNLLATASILSAFRGHLLTLSVLYAAGADLALRDTLGRTVLTWACERNAPILAFVLSKGYRPVPNYFGDWPLVCALAHRAPGVASLALNSTVAFNHQGRLGGIHLGDLMQEAKPTLLRKLLKRTLPVGAGFSAAEQAQVLGCVSALHYAAVADRTEMLEVLLEFGADVETEDPVEGTPLMIACATGRFAAVEFLVRRGARAAYESGGVSWSGVRAAEKYPEVVEWLLVGRYTGQKKLERGPGVETEPSAFRLWSGVRAVEVPLSGKLARSAGKSMLDYCVRLHEFRRDMEGKVWPADVESGNMDE